MTAPIEARQDGHTGRLAQECNDHWRCFQTVSFGLQPRKAMRGGAKPCRGRRPGSVSRLAHGLFDLQRILEKWREQALVLFPGFFGRSPDQLDVGGQAAGAAVGQHETPAHPVDGSLHNGQTQACAGGRRA